MTAEPPTGADPRQHWERVYATGAATAVSWFQEQGFACCFCRRQGTAA